MKNLDQKQKTVVVKDGLKRDKVLRVLCAMSGGVDSSVGAALLKKHGYDVIGVFLKFTQNNTNKNPSSRAKLTTGHGTNKHCENKCCDYESLMAARAVCDQLKIPFYVFDVSKEFKKEVVDYFIKEYDSGNTPNPCVVCNKKIKFGWLLEQAKKLGCEFVATGHYARVKLKTKNLKRKTTTQKSKVYRLFQARDKKKDQSYFLWQLSQEQLAHILFPVGDYTKDQVRKMAKKWKLATAQKKESQDICFISTNNTDFLADHADKLTKPGDIVDLKGSILGKHKGLCYYTVGQRHGLGGIQLKSQISNLKSQNEQGKRINIDYKPVYVVELNGKENVLVIGEEKDLYRNELFAKNVNWINSCSIKHITYNKDSKYKAKIRYGAPLANCQIVELLNYSRYNIKVIFEKPQRAITPGQSVVFYKKEELVGGGVIK